MLGLALNKAHAQIQLSNGHEKLQHKDRLNCNSDYNEFDSVSTMSAASAVESVNAVDKRHSTIQLKSIIQLIVNCIVNRHPSLL